MIKKTTAALALGSLALAFWAAPSGAQTAPVDRQARAWAATCAACHGTNGRGGQGAGVIPSIVGRDAEQTYRTLIEFKTGQRPAATVMHQHTKGYSDDELKRIASFFATLGTK